MYFLGKDWTLIFRKRVWQDYAKFCSQAGKNGFSGKKLNEENTYKSSQMQFPRCRTHVECFYAICRFWLTERLYLWEIFNYIVKGKPGTVATVNWLKWFSAISILSFEIFDQNLAIRARLIENATREGIVECETSDSRKDSSLSIQILDPDP